MNRKRRLTRTIAHRSHLLLLSVIAVIMTVASIAIAALPSNAATLNGDSEFRGNSWRYRDGVPIEQETDIGDMSVEPYVFDGSSKPSGATYQGIDVSTHQGVIDWQQMKARGVDFAIIRCGYGSMYPSQVDTHWEDNVRGATEAGIPWGVYVYSYGTSAGHGKAEADFVLKCLAAVADIGKPSLPIYYDLEDNTVLNSGNAITIGKEFCTYLSEKGYNVGVYANLNWWRNYLNDPFFDDYSRWVAQYNYECNYTGPYDCWQYTSGGSPALSGLCQSQGLDLNWWYGELPTSNPSEPEPAPTGNLRIQKIDDTGANISVAGFEFSVSNASSGGSTTVTATTDGSGVALVENLPTDASASYTITETKTQPGYVLNSEPMTATVTAGSTAEVRFVNEREPDPVGSITLQKVDDTGANVKLAGFEFEASNAASVGSGVASTTVKATTDSNGIARFEDLPVVNGQGQYVVRETKSVEGYVLSDETVSVDLTDEHDKSIEFENAREPEPVPEPVYGSITIQKTDDTGADVKMAGFKFKVSNATTIDDGAATTVEVTTDANGVAKATDLPADNGQGEYVVSEIETQPGYVLSDKTVTVDISTEHDRSIEFANAREQEPEPEPEPVYGSITIQKVDDTGADVKMAGFEFKVSNATTVSSGTTPTTVTVTTNANGVAKADKLPADGGQGEYVVTETKTQDGYVLNDQPLTVDIATTHDRSVDFENEREKEPEPAPVLGSIEVTIRTVDGAVLDSYVEIYNKSGKDVVVNGKSYADGELIGTFESEDGTVSTGEILPVGKYEIIGYAVIDGKKVSSEPAAVDVEKDNIYALEIDLPKDADTPSDGNENENQGGQQGGGNQNQNDNENENENQGGSTTKPSQPSGDSGNENDSVNDNGGDENNGSDDVHGNETTDSNETVNGGSGSEQSTGNVVDSDGDGYQNGNTDVSENGDNGADASSFDVETSSETYASSDDANTSTVSDDSIIQTGIASMIGVAGAAGMASAVSVIIRKKQNGNDK